MNSKIRLRNVPEMDYLYTNDPPRGEICIWSPALTPGYFKNPLKTMETFHGDWLLTGDIGEIDANGGLKIIDRSKNIFKLS